MPPPLIEIDGPKLRLNFHAGQLRAWDSVRRFVAVIAGSQSGKTSFMPIWLWREIQRCGPGDYAVVCPTFTLMELKALPDFRHFFETTLHLGAYTGSPVRRFVVSKLGERLLFGGVQMTPTNVYFGYAENSDSLESSTYKAVVCDEAGQKGFKRSAYEALLRRLSIHQGRMLITTTPYSNGGWLKTEIYDRWKAGDATIEFVQFTSTMNPVFPQAEYDRAVATLPPWKVDLFYRGVFARPAGMIFDCLDDAVHIVPKTPIPSHWPRYLGLDFGGVNTAGVFIAEEMEADLSRLQGGILQHKPTGRFVAYREYRAGGRTAKDHAVELLKGEPGLPHCVGGSASEGQWRGEFRQGGLPVREPAIKDVEVGIDRIYGGLKTRRLFIQEHLTGLRDELGSYARELNEAGEPTEKIAEKEIWHLTDATRYICTYLFRPQSAPLPPQPQRPERMPGGDSNAGRRGILGRGEGGRR